jgi:hypothetical protein
MQKTLGFILIAALTAGCEVILIDPVGTEVTVSGAWTVEGAAPTAESCAALGIAQVRVAFIDGSSLVEVPGLVFPCVQGSFDTRPTGVIQAGTWTVRLQALDATGGVIGQSPTISRTVGVGAHWDLGVATDFVGDAGPTTGVVTLAWTIDGLAPTADDCAAADIATIDLDFFDTLGARQTTLDFPCAAGTLSTTLEAGNYSVLVVARDGLGEVVAMASSMEMFTLEAGTTVALNGGAALDFEGGFTTMGTDATYTVSWLVGSQIPEADLCELVGVARVDLELAAAGDTAFADGITVNTQPCAEGQIDTRPTPVLRAGSYLARLLFRSAAATDNVLQTTSLGTFDVPVNTGTPVEVEFGVDVDYVLAEPIVLYDVTWADVAGTGTVLCGAGGPDSVNYTLFGPGVGNIVYQELGTPCFEQLVFGDTLENPVVAGTTYDLFLEGSLGGIKTWDGVDTICEVTAQAGAIAIGACDVPRAP